MTRPVDKLLLWSVLGLCSLGLVMVYSASAVFADQRFGDPIHFLVPQAISLLLGLCVMVACIEIGAQRLREFAPLVLLLAVALLALIFAPGIGHAAGGATRWVRLGPVSFQPSEFAKPAVVL